MKKKMIVFSYLRDGLLIRKVSHFSPKYDDMPSLIHTFYPSINSPHNYDHANINCHAPQIFGVIKIKLVAKR